MIMLQGQILKNETVVIFNALSLLPRFIQANMYEKHVCFACLQNCIFVQRQPQLLCLSSMSVHVCFSYMPLFWINLVWMHMCVFLCPMYCTCVHVCACMCLCGGCSHSSTLYKHISWADSAQWEGERALRQPGTEAS